MKIGIKINFKDEDYGNVFLFGEDNVKSGDIQLVASWLVRQISSLADQHDKNDWPRKAFIDGEVNHMGPDMGDYIEMCQHPNLRIEIKDKLKDGLILGGKKVWPKDVSDEDM